MKTSKLIFALISLSLFSCATKYQETGHTGGFSETQLNSNVFKVSFKGNAYLSKEKSADFALLPAAELTMNNGFNYFTIQDSNNYTKDGSYTAPSQSNTTFSGNIYGDTISGTARSTHYEGQTYKWSKPRTELVISCFANEPETTETVFDAALVNKSLRNKYKMNDVESIADKNARLEAEQSELLIKKAELLEKQNNQLKKEIPVANDKPTNTGAQALTTEKAISQ